MLDFIPQRFPDDMGRFDPSLHWKYTLFKVRAEVKSDAVSAFTVLCNPHDPHASTKICEASYYNEDNPNSDPVITFASTLSLDTIRSIWNTIPDLHVMVESVNTMTIYEDLPWAHRTFYRPFNVAFLDKCSPGAFWTSKAAAARDFPGEIKEYVVNANQDDLLEYFKANNVPLDYFELYG